MEKVKLHSRMYGWKHVWMEFAEEFQASVDDPNPDSSQSGMSMMVPIKNSSSVLVYTLVPGKKTSHGHTEIEASFPSNSNFKFAIHPQKQLIGLGKLFGMQDIIIGDKDIDPRFVVKGSDAGRVRDLFANDEIRSLIRDEHNLEISVHYDNTDSKPSPRILAAQQHVLSLKVPEMIDDFERLKSFHRLVELLLQGLAVEDVSLVSLAENATTMPAPSY